MRRFPDKNTVYHPTDFFVQLSPVVPRVFAVVLRKPDRRTKKEFLHIVPVSVEQIGVLRYHHVQVRLELGAAVGQRRFNATRLICP